MQVSLKIGYILLCTHAEVCTWMGVRNLAMLDELVCNKKVNVLENRMQMVVYSRRSLKMYGVTYSRLLLYVYVNVNKSVS